MTTVSKSQLANRLLRKLGLVGAGQTASGSDLEIAEEKIGAVHSALDVLSKTRWTIGDVPEYAAEGYVLMASVLAAPEFGAPADPGAWMGGLKLISACIAVPVSDEPIAMESF